MGKNQNIRSAVLRFWHILYFFGTFGRKRTASIEKEVERRGREIEGKNLINSFAKY